MLILAVVPVLVLLLLAAAQPLLELWDDRASERSAAATAAELSDPVPEAALPALQPAAFPESLGGAAVALRIPRPRLRPADAGVR